MKALTHNSPEFAYIRQGLEDKKIYLIPYCHADHAWLHSRDWHLRRYLAIFDKMVELFKTQPDFRYFIDSWSELLAPCLEKRPESIPFLRKMLANGRLALVGGHWSNIRFSHIADESSIRNMIYGRRKINEIFPDARIDSYANLDVGVGHSQVPQLLKLAAYRNYFAWRPQKGLDQQGVPRSFIWKGLNEDAVLVTRHAYQGWFHAPEFVDFKGEDEIFTCREVDFDHLVNNVWEHFLRVPASQSELQTLSFCHGSDDSIPFTDAFYGFEQDIPRLVKQWNNAGLGNMKFGTPNDVFDALRRQENDLPIHKGLLDPAEMCFHIARNGKKSIWWLRELADRELVLAEQLAATTSLSASLYPSEKLKELWCDHLTCCTHAMEFLFRKDIDNVRFTLEYVIREVGKIQKDALNLMVQNTELNDPESYVVYNPLPDSRKEIIPIDVPNIDNSRRQPIFKDTKGNLLPSQIYYVGGLARDFLILVELELHPGAPTQINIDWLDEDLTISEPKKVNGMNAEIESDRMKLTFKAGKLTIIENLITGRSLTSVDDAGLLEPLSLPQKVSYWMPESFADNPLPFIPESLSVDEKGPLRFRITRTGKSGPHFFTQQFDLLHGRDAVNVKTVADLVPDSTNITLGMPLCKDSNLHVDIPFGVEERDLSNITYGNMGSGNYENIERRIPGIFWGRSWCFSAAGQSSFGLITVDGPRYFRRYGNPERLLHFLACIKPDKKHGWMPKTYSQRVLGRNEYQHQLVLAGNDWQEAGMVRRSQELRTKIPIIQGAIENDNGFSITPGDVRLCAFYREDDDFILRLCNFSSKTTECEIRLPFKPRSAEFCDFNGIPQDNPATFQDDLLNFTLRPWEIATVRMKPE